MRLLCASEAFGALDHKIQTYRFLNEDFKTVFVFLIGGTRMKILQFLEIRY
jgi:hypothetical protein